MEKRSCKNCRRLFKACPQRPDQKYCSAKKCQRARKSAWQRKKMQTDRDYRQNQKEAQDRWLKKNPDYYKRYRKNNPVYTEKNRVAQDERNRKKRHRSNHMSIYSAIANMDVSSDVNPINTGRYTISSANDPKFAKMDVIIIDMSSKTGSCDKYSAQN